MTLLQRTGPDMSSVAAEPPAARPRRGVRPCRRDDLPQVAALYEAVVRSGRRSPPPRLEAYFERTFFGCPWADPEIPSLVYQGADGAILGFIGSHVRRLRAGSRTLRPVPRCQTMPKRCLRWAVTATVLTVVAVACLVPARRATRIPPALALRSE